MCAPSEKFLHMGGPLAIGLGIVFASSVGKLNTVVMVGVMKQIHRQMCGWMRKCIWAGVREDDLIGACLCVYRWVLNLVCIVIVVRTAFYNIALMMCGTCVCVCVCVCVYTNDLFLCRPFPAKIYFNAVFTHNPVAESLIKFDLGWVELFKSPNAMILNCLEMSNFDALRHISCTF